MCLAVLVTFCITPLPRQLQLQLVSQDLYLKIWHLTQGTVLIRVQQGRLGWKNSVHFLYFLRRGPASLTKFVGLVLNEWCCTSAWSVTSNHQNNFRHDLHLQDKFQILQQKYTFFSISPFSLCLRGLIYKLLQGDHPIIYILYSQMITLFLHEKS